jgi:hypothetical protein
VALIVPASRVLAMDCCLYQLNSYGSIPYLQNLQCGTTLLNFAVRGYRN